MRHERPTPLRPSRQATALPASAPAAGNAASHRYAGTSAVRGAAPAPLDRPPPAPLSALHEAALRLHAQSSVQLAEAAQQLQVQPSALAAVVLAEGQYLPRDVPGLAQTLPIRFEPYVFFEQTGRWLAATHRDQAAEYRVFEQARSLDDHAAHRALRMGVAQVSGQEAERAGYQTPQEMRSAMVADSRAQLGAWLTVAAADTTLHQALQQQDWQQVALLRAGQGYGALGYDQALQAADAAWRQAVQAGGGDDDDPPKRKRKRT